MVFEKKVEVPFERAVLTKAANVTSHNKSQTLRLVQDAIQLHSEKHEIQTQAKEITILKQQEMLAE